MKLRGIYLNKRLASLLICVILLLGSLPSSTGIVAASPASGPDLQGPTPLVIEGRVEQVISEMQDHGIITSRAIVIVEKVVQGTLPGDQVAIRYEGGTVGDLTLRVSNQPFLVEGMRLRAKLAPGEDGDYLIPNPDTDFTVLEGEIGVTWVPTGDKWPVGSIPVPIQIYANTGDVANESTAVQNAMATWTAAACSYFQYTYAGGAACLADTYDGTNCVLWVPGTSGSTLATSHWWYDLANNILETDIKFYDGHLWSTTTPPTSNDIESVALHELGHSLGLDHTPISAAVMYYQITTGTMKRSLHSDDLNGVCALYPGPPIAPSGLTATPVPPTQINLSWIDNSNNETGFRIERSTNGGATWPWNTTVGPNVTSYPNSGLTCDQTYHYRVFAYNGYGDSTSSNVDYAIPAGDVYEINNTFGDAKLIATSGATQTHNFHIGGDVDWAKFTVSANVPYTATTSNLGINTDTILELYDTDGTSLLVTNDDCPGFGLASCINNWSDPNSGTYFIRVRQFGATGGCTGYGYGLTVVGALKKTYLPLVLKNSL
jgi:hypothetical protein